jgi:STAM-binding protein
LLPENIKPLKAAQKSVQADLAKLEVIKPRIKRRHTEYIEKVRAQAKALESLEGKGNYARQLPHELDGLSITNSKRRSYEKKTLDAGTNRSLAAQLAQREVRRRDAARRSVRQAGVSEEQEQERRTAGMWGEWEKELKRESQELDKDISAQLREVARLQNGHNPPNFSVSCC